MAALISGLGGLSGYGEQSLALTDDGFQYFDASAVFADGLSYFGGNFTGIFVNNNGSISFGNGSGAYTPTAITADGAVQMIAPFWADVDTTGTGTVYVDMDSQSNKITVTWLQVGYFAGHTDKTNSFQLILTDLGECGFVAEFRYQNIEWTTGDASGGVGGLGGTIATAGWTAANGTDAFQLPQSSSQIQMLNLENITGNSGQDGVWQFLIDDNVVNSGGKQSAERLFFLNGRMSFSSELAFAAYGLADYEVRSTPSHPTNNFDPKSVAARDGMGANLKWLTSLDLPRLTPSASGDSLFPINGLCNGVYTNANAAALIGKSSDSLFINFRGTNDRTSSLSPDVLDWTPSGMQDHFDLFAPLIAALKRYVNIAANGIDHIYVSGHSLGASMVEALLDTWNSAKIEAVTFASPGFGGGFDEDSRITNLWIDGDTILNAAVLFQNEGDDNTIYYSRLVDTTGAALAGGLIHSMFLYDGYVDFLRGQGVDLAQLRPASGRDFDRIYCNAVVTLQNGGINSVNVGQEADNLVGTKADEILLGGAASDVLEGGAGGDWLLGGMNDDRLIGGLGNDTLKGGFGADTFVFRPSDIGKIMTFSDQIDDFVNGQDKIDFSAFDAVSGMEGHQPLTFLGSGAFTGGIVFRANGEFRLNGDVVEVDLNGNGIFDFSIKVTSTAMLIGSDFAL